MGSDHGSPVRLAVVGAGFRGRHVYADWCRRHPGQARVVAVADPDRRRRDALADDHEVPLGRRRHGWEELLSDPADVDAIVVATPDRHHVGPAVAALGAGLDVLLEKPIAPDLAGLAAVRAAAARSPATVTVAHVLRHTPFFQAVKRRLDDGAIGTLTGIDHTENIGHQHFAHSYVRGNWRREDLAAPMILAKACHDLDLLRWLVDAPWTSIASSGGLTHFRADNAPAGAPEFCFDGCPVEATCPFHAGHYYLEELAGQDGWPIPTVTDDPSHAGRVAALRRGPYGRCVYRCDNDVADHQVAAIGFGNGATATLTVTAFTARNTRTIRLFGSHGELAGDLDAGRLELRRFVRPGAGTTRDEVPAAGAGGGNGHAGGDDALMAAFVAGVRQGRADGAAPLTSLAASLDSHVMAHAAERARHTGQVVRPADVELAPTPG